LIRQNESQVIATWKRGPQRLFSADGSLPASGLKGAIELGPPPDNTQLNNWKTG
jgi:hypothetical protein